MFQGNLKSLPVAAMFSIFLLLSSCENRRVTYYVENPFPGGEYTGDATYIYNDFDGINLTQSSINVSNVDYSSQQGLLVYQKEIGPGFYRIFSRSIYNNEEIQLTSSMETEFYPVFSPLGDKVAFYQNSDLYIMDSDGSDPRKISITNVDTRYPFYFTGDGQKIIATVYSGSKRDVAVIGILGGGQQILTSWTGGFNPGISADGKKIVFVSGNSSQQFIYTVNIDGLSLFRVTSEPGVYSSPTFSPDGAQIVYMKQHDIFQSSIYLTSVDGNFFRPLTPSDKYLRNPRFLPDERWIVFEQKENLNYDIYFTSVDGRFIVNYTNSPGSSELAPVFNPISPVMYFHSNRNGNFDVWASSLEYLMSIY